MNAKRSHIFDQKVMVSGAFVRIQKMIVHYRSSSVNHTNATDIIFNFNFFLSI